MKRLQKENETFFIIIIKMMFAAYRKMIKTIIFFLVTNVMLHSIFHIRNLFFFSIRKKNRFFTKQQRKKALQLPSFFVSTASVSSGCGVGDRFFSVVGVSFLVSIVLVIRAQMLSKESLPVTDETWVIFSLTRWD